MICFGCEKDNWHLFPFEFTGWKERQLGVCKECGTIAYQIDPTEEQKVKDYYRKEYRGQIGPSNLQTTSRKLNYIKNFIEPWLIEQEKAGRKLIVGDVGCATGYIPNWFRQRGHKATGSEWTVTMRRFAEHFYGLPVTEELPTKHKYDLIVMYHVFEHLVEPNKKLARYVDMIADDGHLLIATPEWLNILDESGVGRITTFQNLYHKDHINVFTYESLNRLFSQAGLVVEYSDRLVYGQSYLLRKAKPGETVPMYPSQDWKEIVRQLERNKKAIELFREASSSAGKEMKFREALNVWPKFPDAYYDWVLNSQQKKDRGKAAELIDECMKLMPKYPKLHIIRAYFLYQNQEYAGALEDFEYLSKTKVNADILMFKGYCQRHLGLMREAMQSFQEASILDPLKWGEAMVWLCKTATDMPHWEEVATQKIKDQLFKQAEVEISPNDPVFETNGNGQQKQEALIPN